jgi:hypothetical protein
MCHKKSGNPGPGRRRQGRRLVDEEVVQHEEALSGSALPTFDANLRHGGQML